jgi:hypothetical protein
MNSVLVAILIATFRVAGVGNGTLQTPQLEPTTGQAKPLGETPLDGVTVEQVRLEIRQRLSWFQSCSASARRRGGSEVRRLDVTWFVSPNGNIKSLRIEGASDQELIHCISRAGRRPLQHKPGLDLIIPACIVFAR